MKKYLCTLICTFTSLSFLPAAELETQTASENRSTFTTTQVSKKQNLKQLYNYIIILLNLNFHIKFNKMIFNNLRMNKLDVSN